MLHDQTMLRSTPRNVEEKILERATELLKSKIDDVEDISVHPLDPSDISSGIANKLFPDELKEFLPPICNSTADTSKKVMSIAQDIISLSCRGKKKMPKNVSLGISVKNSLRSKEFITYLNNLGHYFVR